MTPQLALSLSSTFTQIGAIAAFAALVGLAILSLLCFSQAREIKRLREWAGRAPERAAELEQRVSASAAARVQQPQGAVQAVRPAAAASAVNARPAGAPAPGSPAAGLPGAPAPPHPHRPGASPPPPPRRGPA